MRASRGSGKGTLPSRVGGDARASTRRVGFLFKAGRTERLHAESPTEFFYGMPELQATGWDVEVLTDDELDVAVEPRGLFWRAFSRVTLHLFGLPAWVPGVLGRPRHLERLNAVDVLVATTNSYGFALGVLHRVGRLHRPVVLLAMGLADDRTSARWKAAYRWALRDIDVYALADADARFMETFLRKPVGTFLFGVDTAFWHPGDGEPSEDYVLSIGNDRSRDFVSLIRAWKPEYPMLKVVTKFQLEASAPNVRLIHGDWNAQSLSDVEVRRLYQQARFVVLPIKDTYQPSGQSACLQAMACGQAVAITDFPGLWNREAMVGGETCVLMGAPGSLPGIQTAVERLLASPARAREIGRNSRQMVQRRFHVGAMAEAMAAALAKA